MGLEVGFARHLQNNKIIAGQDPVTKLNCCWGVWATVQTRLLQPNNGRSSASVAHVITTGLFGQHMLLLEAMLAAGSGSAAPALPDAD